MKLSHLLLLGTLATSGCRHARTTADTRAQAQAALDANRPADAIALLEPLAAESPDDLGLGRALTEAHVRAGRTDAWIAELQRRNQLGERPIHSYLLGLAYFSRASDAGPPAIAAFERAISLAPKEAEFHYRLGLVHLESEHEREAVGPLQRAAELAPERAGYRLPLAKALARTGDRAGAVAALTALVAGSPSPSEVATARALMERIEDPFAKVPRAAEVKLEQGLRFLQEVDVPQEAIVAFEELLRDYPDLSVVHALLGLAYQRLDDAGRALDEFKRAIELAPEDGRNHFYLGELYLSRQRPDAARPEFERALALNPLIDLAWYRVGDLALERRELPVAKRAFTTLVHLLPDDVAARGKLSLVHQLEGDYPAARLHLVHVLDRSPDNVEFALRLGLLSSEHAQRTSATEERKRAAEESRRWLQRVLEAQPDNALASRALEQVKGL